MKKIKILYIISNIACKSGVSSSVMNYYRRIDRKKFQIDFLLFKKYDESYEKELVENGSNIYYINSKYSIFDYFNKKKEIKQFFKRHKYDIVELHSPTLSYLVADQLDKFNVPNRIIHTHSTIMSSNVVKNLINHILNFNCLKYFNVYFSCSSKSGSYWYNNQIINSDKYFLILNGIDLTKYKHDDDKGESIRKKLNIKNNKTVAFVGRMSKDKNISFLSKIVKSTIDKDKNIKFIFIGDGNELNKLKNSTKKYNNNVIFLGLRNDVNELLSAFDMVILPSKREGMPMVLIEAQATGVTCIASDTITQEANIGLVSFVPLIKDKWVEAILSAKMNADIDESRINRQKFDIQNCTKELEKIYIDLFKGSEV